MKMIDQRWNSYLGKYEKTFLANTEADIKVDSCGECSEGSLILVIETGNTYMKNADSKWQKIGTAEVLV